MSGIESIGSSPLQYLSLGASSGQASREQMAQVEEQGRQRFESRLDSALEAAGVDQETADSIKADLQAVFEENLSSGSFPPDPAQMQEAIDGVFESYGLDASEILGSGPGAGSEMGGMPPGEMGGMPPGEMGGMPPGPPPGGGMPPAESDSTEGSSDAAQNLLDALKAFAEQQGSETDISELAQSFVDILSGIDTEA